MRHCIAVALAFSSPLFAQSKPDSATHVAIVGSDYAFIKAPATVPAGRTVFSFENKGNVRHELSVVRLRAGVTVQQVLEKGPGAASGKALTDQLIGILIARPGESSGGELLVNLESGHRYLIICTLRDTPDAQQHAAMGMIASFDVP